MKYSKIALLGFMCSGKSSVGAALAAQSNLQFVDLDAILLERSGYSTISEIFNVLGEDAFRRLESDVAGSFAGATQLVIATGGGIIGRKQNIESLKYSGGICVLLDLSFAEVLRRVPKASDRPLLRDRARAEKLFLERQPIYKLYADLIIDTEGKTVEQISSEILLRLR